MAKPKSSALDFELLESRCLLTGTYFDSAHLAYSAPDMMAPACTIYAQDTAAPADCSQAAYANSGQRSPQTWQPQIAVCGPSVIQGGGNANLQPANVNQAQGSTPSVLVDATASPFLSSGPDISVANDVSAIQTQAQPALQGLSDRPARMQADPNPVREAAALNQGLTGIPAVGPGPGSNPASKYVAGIVDETSTPPTSVLANLKHSVQQVFSSEEDSLPQRLSISNAAAIQTAKEQITNAVQIRDQNAAALQITPALSSTAAKEDRLASGASALALQGAAITAGSVGQSSQTAHAITQHGQLPPSHDGARTALAAIEGRTNTLETPSVSVRPTLPFAPAIFDLAFASSSTVITNILPIDFSSLEASIKDFFDQVDQIGQQLSESQVNLLFSTGVMAVAGAVALEIARRKLRTQPATPTLDRAGSIPYSDYL